MTTEQYSIGYDAGYQDGFDAALANPMKQEPVAWKQTVRALTDQCATLIQERDELQKKVWQYEKHGVTCQLYGHKIERSCAECNVDENYAAPVRTKDLTDIEYLQDAVTKALKKAFHLGQTYWQQADSESYAANKKAAVTQELFFKLKDDTRAVIAADREKNK